MKNQLCSAGKVLILVCIFFLIPETIFAKRNGGDSSSVPLTFVFHGIADNALSSITNNYGLNYLIAAGATFGIVKSGFDWQWHKNAEEHKWISNAGFVSVGTQPIASVAVPLGLYLFGHFKDNRKLQITGLAIGQAAILGAVASSVLKAFTGRVPPDKKGLTNDYSGEFRFGFLRGGVYEGWPSSHTATAFAMAAALMELYPDNAAIKYGGLAYASLIGLGVSTNIHWFSDAVAGAFIGYAIGIAVGRGFRSAMGLDPQENNYSVYLTSGGIGFACRF
ncbi:MAG: phosphatase PAP2 family protein [Ignavibacteriaceae bacterium]